MDMSINTKGLVSQLEPFEKSFFLIVVKVDEPWIATLAWDVNTH
jgi:hypothetical protein